MEKTLNTFLVLIIFMLGTANLAFAQQKIVKGTVKDEKGASMFGVTVSVKGTSIGSLTGSNGEYSVTVPAGKSTLVFSFVGFLKQEILINSPKMDVVLKESVAVLDEVVVTAFATQKKVNVTGAISTVRGHDLVATPVGNISNALVSSSPGISGLQTSGEPGRNASNIYIRGQATFGNSNPLVVIDGIEQSAERAFDELNAMDANEIESISILKDASSTAVYGIRAANGVIIATTKRGRVSAPVISFSANYGITKATNLIKTVSSYEYALMRNEGIQNEFNGFGTNNTPYLYSTNDLWKFQHNRDFTPTEVDALPNLTEIQRTQLKNSPALYYGNHDLYSEQFGAVGPQKQINLNISGGTENVKYFTSVGYYTQNSITNTTDYYGSNTGSNFGRYNFRSNFDIKVMKNLEVSVNLTGQFGTTVGPGTSANPYDLSSRYKIIMQYIFDGNPYMAPGIIDGHLINDYSGIAGTIQNPLGIKTNSSIGAANAVYSLLTSGTATLYNTLLDNSIKIRHTMDYLTKGLSIHGTVSYQDNYTKYVGYLPSLPAYSVQRNLQNPNNLEFFGGQIYTNNFQSYGYSNWNKLYLDGGIDYAGSFGGSNVTALLLGKASMYTMPGDANNTPSGVMGLVGRTTYNFKERYMAELNLGYNGTEQFAEGKRFGFFPAASLGWVPTNEPFFAKNKWVSFLKFRGSYGVVGNDLLGGTGRRYLYFPNTYNINSGGYNLGNSDGSSVNSYYSGINEGSLGNPFVTWEKSEKLDFGFESKFLTDRLSFTLDMFKENRDNILTTLGIIPSIYGVSSGSVPPVNIGKTTNQGYEVSLGWNDKIGNVGYSLEGNISYSRNKVLYKAEALNPYPWMNQTGFSIGQKFGLISDGLYNTNAELANRPYDNYTSNRATLGDIRYKDLNGDGIISNLDISPIGFSNLPQYHFNFKFGLNYKGFDFSALFVGTANGSYMLSNGYLIPFYKNAGNVLQWESDGRWTPEKVASGAEITYPRATYSNSTTDNNFITSDFWLISNNFFKLKNAEIGYVFTNKFLRAAKISSLRIYANGNNLFTFKNKLSDKGIDPETTDGSTYVYPITRVFSLGLNIRF